MYKKGVFEKKKEGNLSLEKGRGVKSSVQEKKEEVNGSSGKQGKRGGRGQIYKGGPIPPTCLNGIN